MDKKFFSRVDVQVCLLTTAVVLISSLSIFFLMYHMSYQEMLTMLEDDVISLADYIESDMDKDIFTQIQTAEDMDLSAYQEAHAFLNEARLISGTKYLYTATWNQDGDLIYHVDGLDYDDPDFRNVGDLIEPEFQDPLIRALNGETVMPGEILNTEWGDVFVAYYPLHNDDGAIVAAVGIEFPADSQYQSFQTLRIYTMLLIVAVCFAISIVVRGLFRRISNPRFKDIYNSDYLTKLKNRTAFEVDVQNSIYKKEVQGVTLVLTDLNGLKQVNDQSGHKAGDEYIKACAQALLFSGMGKCVVYRIGGDEFVSLFTQVEQSQVEKYITHVKNSVAAIACSEIPNPSVSMGCGVCQGNTKQRWDEMQRKADMAMYEDKRAFYQKNPRVDKRL